MTSKFCPVCNSLMNRGIQVWHWECSQCRYEKADFEPAINEIIAHQKIDEKFREKGLQSLRNENFNKLLQAIIDQGQSSGRLLDVGCAHGWFLEIAQKKGFQVLGIEPDFNVFKATSQRGLPVRQGFFPGELSTHEQFDVIVFNDVFEHIPDLNIVLAGCRDHLKPDGILVLNLPSSTGVFYKMARFFSRIGINTFFDRLWQKDFPSPHLHYFNPQNLKLLLQTNDFNEIARGSLSILRFNGLFARVSYTETYSFFVSAIICLIVSFAIPLLWAMPSDNVYSIFKQSK